MTRQEPRLGSQIQSVLRSSMIKFGLAIFSLFCWAVVTCCKDILTNAKGNTNIPAFSAVWPYLFNVHPHLTPHADWRALWTERLPCARHGKFSRMTSFICSYDLHTALKCLQLKDMLLLFPSTASKSERFAHAVHSRCRSEMSWRLSSNAPGVHLGVLWRLSWSNSSNIWRLWHQFFSICLANARHGLDKMHLKQVGRVCYWVVHQFAILDWPGLLESSQQKAWKRLEKARLEKLRYRVLHFKYLMRRYYGTMYKVQSFLYKTVP